MSIFEATRHDKWALFFASLALVSAGFLIACAPAAAAAPAWCAYPDPAARVALQTEIDARIAHVHAWLPDVTVEADTVHLLVMSECEILWSPTQLAGQ